VSDYVFGDGGADDRARLDALGALYDDGTIRRLSALGVPAGGRCWEVGAGSGTIARWLAEQVGEGGHVLATDLDTRFLEGLPAPVTVQEHDLLAEPPAEASFDVVHARAVLEHIPERETALANMVRAVRPGGWVLAEDVLFHQGFSDPPDPLMRKVYAAFDTGFRAAGADPEFGVALPRALEEAGLVDVAADVRAPVVRLGTSSVDFMTLSLEQVAPRFVAAGLLDDEEIAESLSMLRRGGGGSALPPLLVAAWGRRP
jgi:SAM-dependent methyltransferase